MIIDNEEATKTAEKPLGKRIMRVVVIMAILVVVFGWLLPQIIDYELVWDALTGLTL